MHDVTLSVDAGEIVAVTGESASGKSIDRPCRHAGLLPKGTLGGGPLCWATKTC